LWLGFSHLSVLLFCQFFAGDCMFFSCPATALVFFFLQSPIYFSFRAQRCYVVFLPPCRLMFWSISPCDPSDHEQTVCSGGERFFFRYIEVPGLCLQIQCRKSFFTLPLGSHFGHLLRPCKFASGLFLYPCKTRMAIILVRGLCPPGFPSLWVDFCLKGILRVGEGFYPLCLHFTSGLGLRQYLLFSSTGLLLFLAGTYFNLLHGFETFSPPRRVLIIHFPHQAFQLRPKLTSLPFLL